MKTLPIIALGCLLTWSALSLHAQDASAGSLTFSSGSAGAIFSTYVSPLNPIDGVTLTTSINNASDGIVVIGGGLNTGGNLTGGAGTLILSGANNWIGATTITGGTLTINGSTTLANSLYSNGNSGVLSVFGGSLSAGLTTVEGATLTLNSAGTTGVTTITNAVLQINSGALIAAAPTPTLANELTTSSPLLITAPTTTAPESSGPVLITQTAIPEPSSLGLLLCGVGLFARRSRKK